MVATRIAKWFTKLSLLLLVCDLAYATPPTVESLQMPAWLERAGTRVALVPGAVLESGDIVSSGEEARIYIRLPDGGGLHFGENTRVGMWMIDVELSNGEENLETKRTIDVGILVTSGIIRVENSSEVTATTRGISGQIGEISFAARSGDTYAVLKPVATVCTVSGQTLIKVKSKLLSLEEPYSCFRANRLSTVETELTMQLAQQVAFVSGKGTAKNTTRGRKLVIASPSQSQEAQAMIKKLSEDGYASQIESIKVKGVQHYRVYIGGLVNVEEAQGLAKRINKQTPLLRPWVTAE